MTGAGDTAATLTPVDLRSDLVDVSTIPFDALRDLNTPALALAIQRIYQRAATTTGNEIQDQRG